MNDRPFQIPADDFVRRFSKRTGSLMWLLGAGASASAGVRTAMDMIWRFKRSLFVSQSSGASDSSVDLSQPAMRNRIDAHIKSLDGMPLPGAPNEYAVLFEAAFPAEAAPTDSSRRGTHGCQAILRAHSARDANASPLGAFGLDHKLRRSYRRCVRQGL